MWLRSPCSSLTPHLPGVVNVLVRECRGQGQGGMDPLRELRPPLRLHFQASGAVLRDRARAEPDA